NIFWLLSCLFLFQVDTLIVFFFFFSSRRRHTRYWRDWSSDVCSSDLANAGASPTPSLTDAQIQAVVNELVQCIRENGAPGMPDVKVENGKVLEPDENSVDETTKQNAESAINACASIRDR